jgi:hypothetical protein
MNNILKNLLTGYTSDDLENTNVIPWSSPIPFFGDIYNSSVATLGLNPSNREFVDRFGKELVGEKRRFPTLNSLNLLSWANIDKTNMEVLSRSLLEYFNGNPYDTWFKQLDYIISDLDCSFYNDMYCTRKACHLDLVPYATSTKWSSLGMGERNTLLEMSSEVLVDLINISHIDVLILNGATVVNTLQQISETTFDKTSASNIDLKRKNGNDVEGYLYTGKIDSICGRSIGRNLNIVGFNHNIQNSFGITKNVRSELKKLVFENTKEFLE